MKGVDSKNIFIWIFILIVIVLIAFGIIISKNRKQTMYGGVDYHNEVGSKPSDITNFIVDKDDIEEKY